jgi:hypothetical protein
MLIALGAGILAGWLALLVALVLMRPKGALLAEAVRLLPDLLLFLGLGLALGGGRRRPVR